ncbi:sterol-binding protein [Longimycelium tulufanense]|uniref:Sterol-binding protein n=1 Tax=Longimycelium tulufanense TaxID=907463 RepID=A0A8J3C8W9_9PSEU|nr:SCP2 sterol-binding domain-containing protein [Longimycelium tulufanense]GGM58027.1 sterol-binding protein [Longimycelium tulufanense]
MSQSQDHTADAITRLGPKELVDALSRLSPEDETIADLDIDSVARAVDPKELNKDDFVALLSAITRLAQGGAALDLTRMAPQNFARLMSRAGKDQIEAVMGAPELREPILDEVFRRMETHFRTEKAGATSSVMHFRITGGRGEDGLDRYEAVIEDGKCSINKGTTRDARATVTLGPAEFLKLATGNASAPVLFMTGKLKVNGDLGFAAGFMSLFDIPHA